MADELIQWAKEKSVLESPFVGPSTKLGIRRLLDGENPMKAGRDGVTNGACMRVSPIGIANIGKIKNCIEETAQACMPTHGTSIAISGASAVSCSIAEAMRDEATVSSIIEAAKIGARRGARLGRIFPHPSIDRKIEMCVQIVGRSSSAREMCREVYEVIGTGLSPAEAVPSAFAIFAKFGGMFKEAVITAANIGGDTDTIASIVGAITGAFAGVRTIPAKWLEIVERKNSLNLGYYASKLATVALRRLGTSDYEKRQQI